MTTHSPNAVSGNRPGLVSSRMLAVCTGGPQDVDALRHVASLAETARTQGTDPVVSVLSVVEREPGEDLIRIIGGASQETLDELRRQERLAHVQAIIKQAGLSVSGKLEVVTGKIFVDVIRHAAAWDIELVVKPMSHTSALHAQVFGSTDLHLLRKCPCPVWILRKPAGQGAAQAPERTPVVMAAVDFDAFQTPEDDADEVRAQDALNREIMASALGIALAHGAGLVIVHVWQAPAEGLLQRASPGITPAQLRHYVKDAENRHHAGLDDLVGVARDMLGRVQGTKPSITTRLLQGQPEDAIAEEANRVHPLALVMGTVGRSGIPGVIIGNTAEDILTAVDGAVLAVKPPGFRSPVRGQ